MYGLRSLSFVATIVAAMFHAVPTRAEIMVADSIEWRVASADAIVRASVIQVQTENGPDSLVIEKATLKVIEILKGKSRPELTHTVQVYTAEGWEKFDRPSRWKRDGRELLLFFKGEGINRHLTTRPLSVPADIQGGDAVAEETPSKRNDVLSVRR